MLSYADALPERPRRVLVAGVSGSGKTTLAGRIAQLTGGPHTEIDGLFHGPGWEPRPEFADDVRAFTAADAWTTEWQYSAVRDLLAQRADLLVWLDLPFVRVTLPRVVHRTLRRRIHGKELWNGNREPPLRTIFRDPEHIIRWSISTRNAYAERVPAAERAYPHLTVVRLRSTREVERWLAGPLRAATAANSS
ncbi:AAA family ATPase [Leifsonia soli]|uniref:Adenylate kinase family enzyme n=1 Tax=Leifsonia soli TaxID=582665 RepID=A0A852SY29_9MICO|nr:adenylate kinase family enzyme [Leifsonia soli]